MNANGIIDQTSSDNLINTPVTINNINQDSSSGNFGLFQRPYIAWDVTCRGSLYEKLLDISDFYYWVLDSGVIWLFAISIALFAIFSLIFGSMTFL
jgi:hypothetical protein